jgi:uncharacterized protein DUF7002
MPPQTLARCLTDNMQPAQWYALLNSKIFFWLDLQRLHRHRRAYGAQNQRILVVDAERMLQRYERAASVSPINTGNAMRRATPRNATTFVPYLSWRTHGWRDEIIAGRPTRPSSHRPVELTIDVPIPDIFVYVTDTLDVAPLP